MKKLFLCLAAVFIAAIPAGGAALAAGSADIPSYSDNFNDYAIAGGGSLVEDIAAFKGNWYNDFMATGDPKTDSECVGVAKIVKDPDNADNQVLKLDNKSTGGSFLHLGVGDIRTKNFEVSFKVKWNSSGDGWVGIAYRKELRVRYNGGNQLFTTIRMGENQLYMQAYRGYANSVADLNDTVTGADGTGSAKPFTPSTGWHTYKFAVNGTETTASIDGTVLGKFTYDKASTNKYGYISLNACVADAYVDDFVFTNRDTEPAPPIVEPADALDAPVVTLEGNVVSWDAVTGALGYIVTVNGDMKPITTSTSYTLSETEPGDYTVTVTASGDGNKLLDSAESNSVTYKVNAPEPKPQEPVKGGCGTLAGGFFGGGAAIAAALGASLIFFKKKRLD